MRPNLKFWRESASIIALARNEGPIVKNSGVSNYKMLLQQRSDKSGFLPSTIVFPGGTTEPSDSSRDWFDHFKSFGFKSDHYRRFQCKNTLLPPILQDLDPIKRHVSLRITAIRETFEELGILICKQRQEEPFSDDKCASYMEDFDIKYWQNMVHKDPLQFLTLCQQLDCYPDIWSLFLWSNWLTPIGYENQRFDTMFFLLAFNSPPPLHAEASEVTQVWWGSQEDVMEKFDSKKVMLPPPQWYELSRFNHQKDMDRLVKYAAARSSLGCDQIYPILLNPTKGKGYLAIFPGDELYPQIPDFEKQTEVSIGEGSLEDLRKTVNVAHRMEVYDTYTINVQLKNFSPVQSQLPPSCYDLPDLSQHIV